MRKALITASVLLASIVTPTMAAEPDLSPATLARLDDRLWAAGDDWQDLFRTLPPEQQKALFDLNAVAYVIRTTNDDRPPACEWAVDCEEAEQSTRRVPAAGGKPVERVPVVEVVPPPPYKCGSVQASIKGYTITGKVVIEHLDWMSYCVNNAGKFDFYDHGHDAATYGWGWRVDSCICLEQRNPPIGDAHSYEFHNKQTYSRQVGFGDFGFVDHDVTNMEGYVRVAGPNKWVRYIAAI